MKEKHSYLKRLVMTVLLGIAGVITAIASDEYSAYLFAYFKGEGLAQGEQIYFAVSEDGLHWNDLNDGNPVLVSNLGEKGLRDPFIMRSAEGDRFFVIATDLKINGNGNWTAAQTSGSKSIMVWESKDLINWSEQRMCQVAPEGAGCTWAPEAVYDDASGEYIVFWSSKIPNSNNVPNNDNTHRVYYCTTKDFKTFSSPKVWIELRNQQGNVISTIDATTIKVGNTYYRFKKNEATQAHKAGMPSNGKYIIMEKSESLLGTWMEIDSDMSKISGVEGPTCFKFNGEDKWCLLIDEFGGKGYYPMVSSDLGSGVFEQLPAGSYSFPSVMRHGSVINITDTEYHNLLKRYDPTFTSAVRINPAHRQQTIEGWGVSLCWWASMCGKWTDDKIDYLANLLTSNDMLNYNIFRYNIGGGDNPSHRDGHMCNGKGKRAEMDGFKAGPNAPYDWTADEGQRKFLLKIKELRPDAIFEAFSNSPPYWMTYSGCASGNKNAREDNLKPEYYGMFCDYMIDVCKHYKDVYDIDFRTLDPFNEPNTNYWGENGSQEGCHFSPETQTDLIRVLYPKLKASGLNTVISACDETNVGTAIDELQHYIEEGDIIPMLGQFNVHTYGGDKLDRVNLRDLINKSGLPFWMSETGAGGSGIQGNLNMAQRMFDDLNYMMPKAWVDWQFVEEKNDQWCTVQGNFAEQTYHIVKNFYVRMQVTRFIKQGYTLLATGRDDILVAESPDHKELVIVMLNNTEQEKTFNIDLMLVNGAEKASLYVTNSQYDCKQMSDLEINDSVLTYKMGALEIATAVIQTKHSRGVSPMEPDMPYLIMPRGTSLSLQAGSDVTISSTNIYDPAQQWRFYLLANGNYVICTIRDGKEYALTNNGSYYLALSEKNKDDKNQQFMVMDIGDNCYNIVSAVNDKMLDLENVSTKAGTKVGLWQSDVTGKNAHREWRIFSLPCSPVILDGMSSETKTLKSDNLIVFGEKGAINVIVTTDEAKTVTVFDSMGRLVSTKKGTGSLRFDVNGGVYIVKCEEDVVKVVVP